MNPNEKTATSRKTHRISNNHEFDAYEVEPTIPGPEDDVRDQEISRAIEDWKEKNTDINFRP